MADVDTVYHAWLARKASALQRPIHDCLCPNDGRITFIRGCCDIIVCGKHQWEPHTHRAVQPEPAPNEPLAETWSPVAVEPKPLLDETRPPRRSLWSWIWRRSDG